MDNYLFSLINSLAFNSSFSDSLFIFFAEKLGYVLIILSFVLVTRDFKKNIIIPFLAIASGFFARYIIVDLIRFFYHQNRPFVVYDINTLIEHASTASFPSGHTSFFFALSFFIFLNNKKIGLSFLIASFLIGFSRIVSGIHWPSDILAGIVVGLLVGYLFFLLLIKIKKNNRYNLLMKD